MVNDILNNEEDRDHGRTLEVYGKHPKDPKIIVPLQDGIMSIGRVLIYCSLWIALQMLAEDENTKMPRPLNKGWYQSFETGALHQIETEMDTAGDFGVSRFMARASISYRKDFLNSTSLSFGYAHTSYQFNALTGPWAPEPWGGVHTMSLSAPIRRSFGSNWMLLAIPSIRTISEDNADLGQSIVGGIITGMSYQVRPGLSIGPGFGVLTQLEDSVNVFPIVLVDWAISKKFKLQTGRGFGASQGPGLVLSYALNDSWNLMVGGRMERFRLRLNSNGRVPNGVGQDRKASVSFGAQYAMGKVGFITLYTGFNLSGELELNDASGNELAATDYDSTPFVGLNASIRF
ncbi:DUF6268 family outer membrane beta-barrel protein [Verrucomicrobia bacterium]|nr:DUF6268 family outer membrane beta-barrel protein [Verrucomicrobiota bacterium]